MVTKASYLLHREVLNTYTYAYTPLDKEGVWRIFEGNSLRFK